MKTTILASLLLAAASPAFADEVGETVGAPVVGTPVAVPEPLPPATAPAVPVEAPVSGGYAVQTAPAPELEYSTKGVREAGASMGLMMSSQFRSVSIAPSFGYFVADQMKLSAILAVSNVKAGSESATTYAALVEPSYHVPFDRGMYGFLGMGIGAAYESTLGTGLAVAPRLGANFLVGSSGVLTPSLQYTYISHKAMPESSIATAAMTSAMTVNVGYTAIW